MAKRSKTRPGAERPRLSAAQKRYLRNLLADPDYVGRRGRTRQTAEALVRKGVARWHGSRLKPLWDPDRERWL